MARKLASKHFIQLSFYTDNYIENIFILSFTMQKLQHTTIIISQILYLCNIHWEQIFFRFNNNNIKHKKKINRCIFTILAWTSPQIRHQFDIRTGQLVCQTQNWNKKLNSSHFSQLIRKHFNFNGWQSSNVHYKITHQGHVFMLVVMRQKIEAKEPVQFY